MGLAGVRMGPFWSGIFTTNKIPVRIHVFMPPQASQAASKTSQVASGFLFWPHSVHHHHHNTQRDSRCNLTDPRLLLPFCELPMRVRWKRTKPVFISFFIFFFIFFFMLGGVPTCPFMLGFGPNCSSCSGPFELLYYSRWGSFPLDR